MLRILAIDGPSGSGKSSLARALATHFDMRYLDTGALYRTVTLAAIKLDLLTGSDEAIVNALPGITVTFEANPDQPRALLNGQDVSEAIRTPEVTASVSRIAAIPGVRQYLLRVQREFLLAGSLAIEGRDIGTKCRFENFPHCRPRCASRTSARAGRNGGGRRRIRVVSP